MVSLTYSLNFFKHKSIQLIRRRPIFLFLLAISILCIVCSLSNRAFHSNSNNHRKKYKIKSQIIPDSSYHNNKNGYNYDNNNRKLNGQLTANYIDNNDEIKKSLQLLYDYKPSGVKTASKLKTKEEFLDILTDNDSKSNELRKLTEFKLNQVAEFTNDFVNELKSKHSFLVSKLPEFDESKLNFNGNGLVLLAGSDDDLTWLALLSARLFRKNGGTLPIEVMLPSKSDYLNDKEICDTYLPQLNAECIIMDEKLDLIAKDLNSLDDETSDETRKVIEKNNKLVSYILKNKKLLGRDLALLASKFQNVLLLTPDNFILKPMDDTFFKKQIFVENGLMIWNDFWKRYISPKFYEISNRKIENTEACLDGLPLPESKQISSSKAAKFFNYNDRKGSLPFRQSDGSQLIIDKKKHWKTILLSTYYNLNGPGDYYSLWDLTGDHISEKESFTVAANSLNLPFYNINTEVEANGFWYDNSFQGVAMLQYDPIVDSFSYNTFIEKYQDKSSLASLDWASYQKWLKESNERKSGLFLKPGNPRLLPVELFKNNIIIKDNGDRLRLFSETNYFGKDFETIIFRIMNDYICHYGLHSNYLNKHFTKKNSAKRDEFCNNDMKQHLLWLVSGQ